MKREVSAAVLALLAAGALASAQERVDEHRSASAKGTVTIENPAGSVRVIGWDKAEVAVTGQIGRGATGLSVTGAGDRTHVEVEAEENPMGIVSDLEVHVPAGSRVHIEGFSSSIAVSEVTGTVSAETVNGPVSVSGHAGEVHVETVNGSVEVDGASRRTHAEAVNGPVTVRGVGGELEASTVNGVLTVTGAAPFDRLSLETVAGALSFDGALSPKAEAHLESVSGGITLTFPAGLGADVTISTFSGRVENAFGPEPPAGQRRGERELNFSTGGGGAAISINTLSGAIVLRKK